MGFQPRDILVNGVGKGTWLRRDFPHLNVIFDSLKELELLARTAVEQQWRCGIRIAVSQQTNADYPAFPVQFGIAPHDVGRAHSILKSAGAHVDVLHFHLRSNVPSVGEYLGALLELSDIARKFSITASVVDIGGGLTEPGIDFSGHPRLGFPADEYVQVIERINQLFPSLSEIWAENGRFLMAPSTVLVGTIIDSKHVDGYRILICDAGRTNHAMPSEWERHYVDLAQCGDWNDTEKTIIHGPTCMAYDTIFQGPFPKQAQIGDRLIYFNAGAYHLPWETRFSAGLCKVLWTIDGNHVEEIRAEETPDRWFSTWHGY